MAPEKTQDIKSFANEIVKRVNDDDRRIRMLEQNSIKTESSFYNLEENILSQLGDLKIGLEKITSKILQLSDKLSSMESEISRLNKEVGKSATKMELKQLEGFIDLVNPVTSSFVTKDELNRAIEEMRSKKR